MQYQFANNGSNHVIRKISCVLNRIKTHQETFTIKDAAAYGTVMDLFESINQIHTCLSSPPASFQGLLCCKTWLNKSFGWIVCWSNHFLNSCLLEVILNNVPTVFMFNTKNMTNQYLQHDVILPKDSILNIFSEEQESLEIWRGFPWFGFWSS